jgi:hypothetical protein
MYHKQMIGHMIKNILHNLLPFVRSLNKSIFKIIMCIKMVCLYTLLARLTAASSSVPNFPEKNTENIPVISVSLKYPRIYFYRCFIK